MLLSRKTLQRVIGALWLIDGLFQLQPQMFTMNMVNKVMNPMLSGQPGLFVPSLQFIVNQTTAHLVAVNLLIVIVQVLLGIGFLVLPDRWIRDLVWVSVVWAVVVWYGGEGMNMLFTGQASMLTGAPGAVLLYPLLGFAVIPRRESTASPQEGAIQTSDDGLLSRKILQWVFAGFWIFAALLQIQPYWWQAGQISQAISGMVGQGGLDTFLVDPVLQLLSKGIASIEIPLNIVLIIVSLAIGIGLAAVKGKQLRPFLIAAIIVSVIVWYFAEGFGMIFTGMATDFNSGLLLVVIALACWPRTQPLSEASTQPTTAQEQTAQELQEQTESCGTTQPA